MAIDKWISGTSPTDPNGTNGDTMASSFNELVNQTVGSGELMQASTDLNYYISAGQSLSIGYTDLANTPINTTALANTYLYNGVPAIAPNSNQSLVPADVASTVAFTQPSRETHIYSMLDTLKGKVGGTWLVAPCGRGGQSIVDLTTGTEPYINGLTMRDSAVSAATSLGFSSLSLPFTTWIQGESDVLMNLTRYKYELDAYITSLNIDFSGVSGGKSIPVITSQVGTSGSVVFAAGELDISNSNPSVYCAGPNWPISRLFPSTITDYTHLNAQGYVHLGNMLAATVEQIVYRGFTNYKPMQPKSVKVSGSTVQIEFHVPKGRLVVDTTTFPEAPMLGIRYGYGLTFGRTTGSYNVSGNTVTLDFAMNRQAIVVGATISGGNTLTDHTLTNGIEVPLINLRGSESNIKDWFDWCCQFNITLTKEMGALDPETDNVWTFGTPTINDTTGFKTVAGDDFCYFLDGTTYLVEYDSADIISGGARIWVGDANHTIVAGGASVVLTRGATTRLRFQTLSAGFNGRVNNLRITKAS